MMELIVTDARRTTAPKPLMCLVLWGLFLIVAHATDECYYARCKIKPVDGLCTPVTYDDTVCGPNVGQRTHHWSLQGGSVRCTNGTCCPVSSGSSVLTICVTTVQGCNCNNRMHALSCRVPPRHRTCGQNSVGTTAGPNTFDTTPDVTSRQFSVADTTTFETSTFTWPNVQLNHTAAGELANNMATNMVSSTAATVTSNQTAIPQDNDETEIGNLQRMLCRDNSSMKMFMEIEKNLMKIGERSVRNKTNQLKYSDNTMKIITSRRNCTSTDTIELGKFTLLCAFGHTGPNGECPEYVVAASQFNGTREQRNSFIPKEEKRSKWDAKREYMMMPEDSPYLSVSGYATEDMRKLNGNVAFTAKMSHTKNVVEKFMQQVEKRKRGEKVFLHGADYTCGYFDTEEERFSTYGTMRIDTGVPDEVKCKSNHTSVFAIMLSVQASVIPRGVQICSYVTESLSVFFLAVTVGLLRFGQTASNLDRVVVQINSAASLLMLHVVSLFHDLALDNDLACFCLAVASHYFLCTTGMWMLVEGTRVLIVTSDHALLYRAQSYRRKRTCCLFTGWGFPLLIVIPALVVGTLTDSYMKPCYLYEKQLAEHELNPEQHTDWVQKYDRCWLDPTTTLFIVAVIVPIATVLFLNVVITTKVTVTVIKMKRRSKKRRNKKSEEKLTIKDDVYSAVRALVVLIPVLGIPWTIGFFTGFGDYETSVLIMYINAIVNGLQGMMIFVLCVVVNPDVRNMIMSWVSPSHAKASKAMSTASQGGQQLVTITTAVTNAPPK